MSNDEKYVFYGGSLEEPIEAGCHSLGELIIKRLKENGDGIAFVSSSIIGAAYSEWNV